MEEQLKQALKDLLETSGSIKDFVVAEAPEVIQQLLIWKAGESGLYFLIGIGLYFYIYWIFKKQIKVSKNPDHWFSKAAAKTDGGIYALNVFLIIPFMAACSFLNITWLQILISPKVFLLEYAAKVLG